MTRGRWAEAAGRWCRDQGAGRFGEEANDGERVQMRGAADQVAGLGSGADGGGELEREWVLKPLVPPSAVPHPLSPPSALRSCWRSSAASRPIWRSLSPTKTALAHELPAGCPGGGARCFSPPRGTGMPTRLERCGETDPTAAGGM